MDADRKNAIKNNDIAAVQGLLDRGANIDSLDRYGRTTLLRAMWESPLARKTGKKR